MFTPNLAIRSLLNRKLTASLTISSIGLSVCLLIGVEHIRKGARESFSNALSQTDLIVGARGGSLQLLLYAVFHMGSASNNITFDSYTHFKNHPAVDWTIPLSLGDSHRGFRVVATNPDFYRRYRFRQDHALEFAQGAMPADLFDVVVGSQVAKKLAYALDKQVVIAHGISEISLLKHKDKPFRICGILKTTGTPVDRGVYITLEGMEAVHMDWKDGAPPMPGLNLSADVIRSKTIQIDQITAFLLRTKSRIETLRLQREINDYADEPLMAVIPGVALAELWNGLGYAEDALKTITLFLVLVGLLGMLISIYTTLNERRREMAILRSLGAGPRQVIALLLFESGFLSLAGAGLGVLLYYGLLISFQPVILERFGLFIPVKGLSGLEWMYLFSVVAAGMCLGLVPAFKAYRNALSDGLSIRV
jgi:putative ABC transport system permease protein